MSFKALFLCLSLVIATPIAQAEISITHNGEIYFELGNDGVLMAKDLCRKITVPVMENVKEQHIVDGQVFAIDRNDQLHYVGEYMSRVPRDSTRQWDDAKFSAVTGIFAFALMSPSQTVWSAPLSFGAACSTYFVLANQNRQHQVQTTSIDNWLQARGYKERVESFEIKKESRITKDIILTTDKHVYLVSEILAENCENHLAPIYPF